MPVPRPYMPDGMKIAEVIQSSFEKIGVKAEIVTYDWATYLDKVSKGEADAFLMGWTGDNGDPDNFIYTLLDKDNIGGNNYTYFSNDELHDILIEAQSDPDQRKEINCIKMRRSSSMKNRLGFRLSIPRRFWPVQKISTDMFRTRQGVKYCPA